MKENSTGGDGNGTEEEVNERARALLTLLFGGTSIAISFVFM